MSIKEKYNEYLSSEAWKELRKKKINQAGRSCEICSSSKKIHVHHLFYKKDKENTELDELRVLCERCHVLIHKITKKRAVNSQSNPESVKRRAVVGFDNAKVIIRDLISGMARYRKDEWALKGLKRKGLNKLIKEELNLDVKLRNKKGKKKRKKKKAQVAKLFKPSKPWKFEAKVIRRDRS